VVDTLKTDGLKKPRRRSALIPYGGILNRL
jgi:hypothetical protein